VKTPAVTGNQIQDTWHASSALAPSNNWTTTSQSLQSSELC